MDGYYVGENIPEIFKTADRYIEQQNPQPKYVDMTRKEPIKGLEIDSNPRVLGPIKMTQDYYDKAVAKKKKKREKDKKKMRIEMIQLIAERDMLRKKLGELDISNRKEARKIASINIRLDQINKLLCALETQSGESVKELDRGTKPARIIGGIKKKVRKTIKKIKKFIKRNEEFIISVTSVVIPIVVMVVAKSIV